MEPRRDALCGKIDSAAITRSALARTSADARAFAAGDRPAGFRPARSVERVQVGSVSIIRVSAYAPARGRDGAAHAGRDHAGTTSRAAEPALHGGAPYQSGDRGG